VFALRVLGLWLLYALVGVLLVIALVATADPGLADGGGKSPTGWAAKLTGGLSGLGLGALGLGLFMATDPGADPIWAFRLVVLGAGFGGVLAASCWVSIARDLRTGRR